MRHRLAALTVVLMLTGVVAGCGRDKGGKPSWGDGASPAASAGAGAGPGALGAVAAGAAKPIGKPPAAKDKMSAAGYGPFAIGASQAELAKAGLIGKVTSDLNGCANTAGSSKWNSPGLVFGAARLAYVRVTTKKISTTEGVTVGAAYKSVQAKYPGGKALADWVGAVGWYVKDGDFALLFRFKQGKVAIIEAGDATSLEFSFTDAQGC